MCKSIICPICTFCPGVCEQKQVVHLPVEPCIVSNSVVYSKKRLPLWAASFLVLEWDSNDCMQLSGGQLQPTGSETGGPQ